MRVRTYESDIPLFHKLGLQPYDVDCHVEHFVGEVKSSYSPSTAKIWVEGAPAQFFKFEVFDSESNQTYHIKTGSGELSDFWPTIEKMMNNMFVIKSIEVHESKVDDRE